MLLAFVAIGNIFVLQMYVYFFKLQKNLCRHRILLIYCALFDGKILTQQTCFMENVIDLLYELKRKCISSDAEFSSHLKISESEYNFFVVVSQCKTLSSKAIAEKMQLSLSRVSRVIDKLVKNGYIRRTIDESDRRNILIELTKKGLDLKSEIDAYRNSCEERLISNLPAKELSTIKDGFKKVIDIL